MTEDEQQAFEQRMPTTLPAKRGSCFSWSDELLFAAAEADVPRMARALKQGANPKTTDTNGTSIVYRYIMGASGIHQNDLRLQFTATDISHIWAWFKAHGMLESVPTWKRLYHDTLSPDVVYTNTFAHPVDAHCAEVNLWAVWGNASHQERCSILTYLDTLFLEARGPSTEPVPVVEGVPPFTSRVMSDVMAFKDIAHTACGQPLPVHQLQDRVLALSSLLAARAGLSLDAPSSTEMMLLGLWGYAPAPVLHDLTSLPSYHTTVTDCFTRLIAMCRTIIRPKYLVPEKSTPLPVLIARRFARGTRTLLQNGFAFPSDMLKDLLTLYEVQREARPLLEQRLLEETLKNAPHATLVEPLSPSRPRL